MTKLKQIEDYPIGDCFRTCIACLLNYKDPKEIPNFMDEGDNNFQNKFDQWLKDTNLSYIELNIESFKIHPYFVPLGECIVVGKSPRGNYNHAVIGQVIKTGKYDKQIETVYDVSKIESEAHLDNILYIGFLRKNI